MEGAGGGSPLDHIGLMQVPCPTNYKEIGSVPQLQSTKRGSKGPLPLVPRQGSGTPLPARLNLAAAPTPREAGFVEVLRWTKYYHLVPAQV